MKLVAVLTMLSGSGIMGLTFVISFWIFEFFGFIRKKFDK